MRREAISAVFYFFLKNSEANMEECVRLTPGCIFCVCVCVCVFEIFLNSNAHF